MNSTLHQTANCQISNCLTQGVHPKTLTILKKNSGLRITSITYGGKAIDGYFVNHSDLEAGKELVITTE